MQKITKVEDLREPGKVDELTESVELRAEALCQIVHKNATRCATVLVTAVADGDGSGDANFSFALAGNGVFVPRMIEEFKRGIESAVKEMEAHKNG